MTTWKSILTSPPTLYKTSFGLWSDTVLATNGTDVFIGNVAKGAGDLFFTGRSADCYEREESRTAEYDLTGWQWMPMTAPEREKTADGMLLKCGYERVEPETSYVVREYAKQVNGREWRIVATRDGLIEVGTITDMTGLEFKTILACAQLIKELGANDAQ